MIVVQMKQTVLVGWRCVTVAVVVVAVVGCMLVAVRVVQEVVDVLHNEIDGDRVFSATRYNYVRVLFRWQTKLFKCRSIT